MLFTIEKNKSLALLKIVMALFVVLAPSIMGILGTVSGAYAVGFFSLLLLMIRIKDTEKFHVSIFHFIALTLLFYSLVSSIWASNKEGHMVYLLMIGSATAFFSLAADYFCENSRDAIGRRMMYLLSAGGIICAFVNIMYWIMYIVPVAEKASFSQGLGSADALAVFMVLCIYLSLRLIKGNSALRRCILVFGAAIMLFVFVMAKSLIGWVFTAIIAVVYIFRKKPQKFFVVSGLLAVAVFEVIVIFIMSASSAGEMFSDAFSYSMKHAFGIGGGFESAQALFATKIYGQNTGTGLFMQLFGASGILGLLCAVVICIFSIYHFVSLKSWESLIELFITSIIMTLPFADGFAVLLLWVGIMAYNEQAGGHVVKRVLKQDLLKKINCVLLVVSVISAMLLCQSFMRKSADMKFENGEYMDAYSLYRAAAAINITDAQSCHMAAESLRRSKSIEQNRDEAIILIDKAIERDRKNITHIEEKAKIYYDCKDYELSASMYKEAAKTAIVNGEHNLSLVKALYQTIKQKPKGSSESKRAYEQIVEIAQKTENLDYRKKINDIADKALSYTKGELVGEEIGN